MIEPCTFIIFGATGNLAQNKLLPALYQLECAGRLVEGMNILGFGRREWNDEAWRDNVIESLAQKFGKRIDEDRLNRFRSRLHFFHGDLGDESAFLHLNQYISKDNKFSDNLVFYMAVRPSEFATMAQCLGQQGLNLEEKGWRRLVIEKPFGYDLESAQILEERLHRHFTERQIFRIDHYLGKETIQNILVYRFANLMLEPLWNRNYIDHVQITHSEIQGIEKRADYYDNAGAMRDMMQSHLLQLLTLVAMEPPVSMEAESLRDEKVKVLKSIRPIPHNAVHAHAHRAQYMRGVVSGKKVAGYLDEEAVPPKSTTETYAALKLYIDNWRWRNVPFYVRTGKRMAANTSHICIRFKHPPQQLFRETQIQQLPPNWVLLGIQPHECLRHEMQVKLPGLEMRTRTISLDAVYSDNNSEKLDAYAALLLDVIDDDHSLFLRYDEVRLAWQVVDPIIKVWSTERDFIHTYPAGSWGPESANRLFDHDNQTWRNSLELASNGAEQHQTRDVA